MATEELDKSAAKKIEGDEFYERIEAPKFVDFTLPDHYRPDDRYWFCLRVGCDRKHEEEMDSEAIYKDFVLRVMAARSPNIKIRKMLNRKPSSTLKYPHTAPAKPSKSRISRLAVISSISRKLDVTKDKAKPPQKLITATPKGTTKQPSSITKAFTTPRNRKRVSNPDKFRSVRNPNPMANIAVAETTKVVAKALVFRSPKKTVKIKTSLEMKTPVTKLCAAMSKLQIENGKQQKLGCNNKAMPLEKTARKPLRGREVKSRVYDSLRSHTNKGKGKLPLKNVKKKKLEKEFEPSCDAVKDNDSSDMEIDERSRHGSLEGCSVSVSSENIKTNGLEVSENNRLEDKVSDRSKPEEKVEISEETNSPKVMNNDDKENNLPCDDKEEKVKVSEGTNSLKNIDKDEKENALPSTETENDGEAIEYDDKENASASNDNREPNVQHEAEILTNHDREKANQVTKNPLKKGSIGTPGLQEAKYKKPKPTNPKPFRLRTDERGILKESTLERKLVTPLKEITTSIKPSASKSLRKNQNSSQKNENCQGQSQNENVTCEDGKNCMYKAPMEQQPRRAKKRPVSTKEHARAEGVKSSDRSLERTTSSTKTPQGIGSSRRKTARLGGVKEVAKLSERRASSSVPRSMSRGRRATTIPKEPNFHAIHVPKSCTRKIAA